MDRVRKLSNEILEEHKSKFGVDFFDNKKILDDISIIRSKGLKNEIAGFITKLIKREIRTKKEKEELEKQFSDENSEPVTPEQTESTIENSETSEETQTNDAPEEPSQETEAVETNNDTSKETAN